MCIPVEATGKVQAAVDGDGRYCLVHNSDGYMFRLYTVQVEFGAYNLKAVLNLTEELSRTSKLEQLVDDRSLSFRFLSDNKTVRFTRAGFQVDYNVTTQAVVEVRRLEKHSFEDRSIFKYGLTYVDHHEQLQKFISEQTAKGNLLAFPDQEFQSVVVLDREDPLRKHFLLVDVFSGQPLRRLQKLESLLLRPGQASDPESDIFDVDPSCQVLIYSQADDLLLWSISVPEPLKKHLKPRYNLAQFKENPAKIASQRMAYIEKLA